MANVFKACMDFMEKTLPLSDVDVYPPALFREFAQHAAMLRESVPWCSALDETRFLHYVLYPRANDEDIVSHRPLFYKELYPRVAGLSAAEAALEVNRWCGEYAAYQPQDSRTASPLAVYRSGLGRCGELSAFLVAALRSVGLAARQVYVPRWSHCDDNHAWVEVFCDGGWHFMGACEPEPVLDLGWFNKSAARAVLIHSRTFGAPDPSENLICQSGGVYWYNQTARYASVKPLKITVVNNDGPVPGVAVTLEILNYTHACPITSLVTGADGACYIDLGAGDVLLTACHDGLWGEAQCNATGGRAVVLELAPHDPSKHWSHFDFGCARPGHGQPAALTQPQQQSRKEALERGGALRQARENLFCPQGAFGALRKARGNYGEVSRFLAAGQAPVREQLLESLNDKDLRDITADILEDHLAGALPYAGLYPADIFKAYLLCPRIALENISPWRQALGLAYGSSQRRAFTENPGLLWQALRKEIRLEEARTYSNLYWQPEVALAKKRCDAKSLRVLFVALLRAFGLPARLSPLDGQTTEYWKDGRFVPVEAKANGGVVLCKEAGDDLRYGQNWALCGLFGNAWLHLSLAEESWTNAACRIALPEGSYRLTTAARLPGGNQKAARFDFDVDAGEDTRIDMCLRTFVPKELLYKKPLPREFSAIAEARRCTLLVWLEPGAEPTDHFQREMAQNQDAFDALGICVRRMAPCAKALPPAIGQDAAALQIISEYLDVDAQNLPVAVLCDGSGNAVYDTGGYSVGSVGIILEMAKYLCREHALNCGRQSQEKS